ncbi:MAG TPA: tRNA pseudouridine(55) synthase TruB [Pyrinomonadaceae bacterium]|nr:tRNA pseudouridine(55) synthase TruB [Pyrinomonadaceae bacterium]
MDGVLIIDKPAGWTSHDVVARVRRILRERRVGHTGTLDPFATGVLVVLVGRATRLAQFLAGAEKEYEARVRFGYATETGDLTGARRELPQTKDAPGDATKEGAKKDSASDGMTEDVSEDANEDATNGRRLCAEWSVEEIEAACASLRGEIEQVPPMYSAKKVQGKKLYELARRGIEVERAPVRVTIRELEVSKETDGGVLLRENEDGTCDLDVRVVCSAGTYIRVLAEDLGARLSAGAHLAALRRTRAGAFRIEEAVTLESLAEKVEAGALGLLLIAPEAALPQMPFVHLTGEAARRARHGAAVLVGANDLRQASGEGETVKLRDGELVKMRDGEAGRLIAVGVYDAGRASLQPRVMLDAGEEK